MATGMERLTLLCLSMERVLGKSGATLISEPIKGSAPRTGDADADELEGDGLPLHDLAQAAQFVEHAFQHRKQFRRLVAGAFSDGDGRRRERLPHPPGGLQFQPA